jgi:glutamate synthase (NADPH) large chain
MILDDFNNWLPKFIKVIPYDYKKVLQELKLEEIKRKIAGVEVDVEMGT